MVSTKLLVSAGAPLHDNCGETFWPTQFGLGFAAPGAFMFATFCGIIVPSLKVVELRVKGACAENAAPLRQIVATRAPPASRIFFIWSSKGCCPTAIVLKIMP